MKKDVDAARDTAAGTFDANWKTQFDLLGEKPLSVREKAAYEGEIAFRQRDVFLSHLITDLSRRLGAMCSHPQCVDVGCNMGYYTHEIRRQGLDVMGLDYSETLISEARQTYPEIEFKVASAYALPFPDMSVDGVTTFGLLQCVENWQQVFQEIVRVLRPGGIAVVETNLAFGPVEALVRAMFYATMNKQGFRRATAFYRAHRMRSQGISVSTFTQARNYDPSTLLYFLRQCDVEAVVLHMPRVYGLFHRWWWGFTIQKARKSGVKGSAHMIKCGCRGLAFNETSAEASRAHQMQNSRCDYGNSILADMGADHAESESEQA